MSEEKGGKQESKKDGWVVVDIGGAKVERMEIGESFRQWREKYSPPPAPTPSSGSKNPKKK